MQPVPCVLAVAIRGARIQCGAAPATSSKSLTTSPAKCPPLSSTARAPFASSSCAAACMSASLVKLRPTNSDASSRFGVTSTARPNNSRTNAAIAGLSISTAPLVATITGSSTTWGSAWRSMASATT